MGVVGGRSDERGVGEGGDWGYTKLTLIEVGTDVSTRILGHNLCHK